MDRESLSDDSMTHQEIIEKIRLRYRKEATKAIEEAEGRGYENGKLESKKTMEDEISKWKAIAESVQSVEQSTAAPNSLVKYMMEHIYKDMKKEFGEQPEVIQQLKTVLIASTTGLMEKLPDIAIVSNKTTKIAPIQSTISTQTMNAPAVCNTKENKNFLQRLELFGVNRKSEPPQFYLRINIPSFQENLVKGIFTDSGYITYQIETEMYQLQYNEFFIQRIYPNLVFSNSIFRRNSEFRALNEQLQKEIPFGCIPSIPSAAVIVASLNEGNVSNQLKTTSRKRLLEMWLRYLSCFDMMQKSTTFISFITGSHTPGGAVMFCTDTNDQSNYSINTQKKNEKVTPRRKALTKLDPSQPQLNKPNVKVELDSYIFMKSFNPLFKYVNKSGGVMNETDPMDIPSSGDSGDGPHNRMTREHTRRQRLICYSDLVTVQRDIAQLEPNAKSAVEVTLALARKYIELASAYSSLKGNVQSWCISERDNTFEKKATQTFATALSSIAGFQKTIADAISQNFYETLYFLYDYCMNTAKETVEKALKLYRNPTTYSSIFSDVSSMASSALSQRRTSTTNVTSTIGIINSPVPDTSDPTTNENMMDPNIGSNSPISPSAQQNTRLSLSTPYPSASGPPNYANDDTIIPISTNLASSWDSSRRVRTILTLQLMHSTALTIALQHGCMVKKWEEVSENIEKLNHLDKNFDTTFFSEKVLKMSEEEQQYSEHNPKYKMDENENQIDNSRTSNLFGHSEATNKMNSIPPPTAAHNEEAKAKSPRENVKTEEEPHRLQLRPTRFFSRLRVGITTTLFKGSTNDSNKQDAAKTQTNNSEINSTLSHNVILNRASLPIGIRRDPSSAKPIILQEESADLNLSASATYVGEEKDNFTQRPTESYSINPEPLRDSNNFNMEDEIFNPSSKSAKGVTRMNRPAGHTGYHHRIQKTSTAATSSNSSIPSNIFGESPPPAASIMFNPGPIHAVPKSNVTEPLKNQTTNLQPPVTQSTTNASTPLENEPAKINSSSPRVQHSAQNRVRAESSMSANNSATPHTNDAPVEPTKSVNQSEKSPREVNRKILSMDNDLPDGWEQVKAPDGSIYYYHKITRISRWDKPSQQIAEALDARLTKSNTEVEEAVNRRKQELDFDRQQKDARAQTIDQVRPKVEKTIKAWAQPSGPPFFGRSRDICELLSEMHKLLKYITDDGVVTTPLSIKTASSAEVRLGSDTLLSAMIVQMSQIKRAYMKAAKYVHPDKLPENIEVEEELIAESIFIVLTDAFNAYRAKQNS